MYGNFDYEAISLDKIELDDRNPRIVTQQKLASQQEILDYLVEFGDVEDFTKKIVAEGKNPGGERPYIVKNGKKYVVIEGNTRIASYKILTGLSKPSASVAFGYAKLSEASKTDLLTVDCTIASSRDSLMPIMARSHFGAGDKSKWSYLGNRKALYDEWKAKKTIPHLAKVFERTESQIRELIIEYMMYLKALEFKWTDLEKSVLTKPSVEFNPPIRFLQTSGHKGRVGVTYDMTNLAVTFTGSESLAKYQHLLRKLVVQPVRGLGATASYDEVFVDYKPPSSKAKQHAGDKQKAGSQSDDEDKSAGGSNESSDASQEKSKNAKPKPFILFGYPDSGDDALISQLMSKRAS